MKGDRPKAIYLKDYTPPEYRVERIDLRFDLGEDITRVCSRLEIVRDRSDAPPLVLNGQGLELRAVRLDDRTLTPHDYSVDPDTLIIRDVPARFVLEIENVLRPQENTSLEGLYKSSGNFCTQCEAEGFRKITYYLDRPDVMARFSTTIAAERERYPVLLSNGNLVEQGELDDGRHWVRWEDPFPKPCYLFALVAGDLRCVEDRLRTRSGRDVALRIYTEAENTDKCDHAMASLRKAMRWDEERFGLEYDLDAYMIVAVNDFNMGAMENKGLNIFNSKYILARPETATDADYEGIENVVGHEYFHNWTGNRVTCRDWFQLSLKEGLTVFRDQEFSADMRSRPVKRIEDVRALRNLQFPEDAGPMAHPVRPDSYVEINNFYTATVYEKGAEVLRMYQTLLGRDGFRRGLELYLQRHDGEAVTTDDFCAAMADANGVDLEPFKRWYSQAGTPVVRVTMEHDAATGICTVALGQHCPPTPGQEHKEPLVIPFGLGLVDRDGRDIPLRLQGEPAHAAVTSRVLRLTEQCQVYRFEGVEHEPVPSLLREFSAPVKLEYDYTDEQLAFLMAHDSDLFNRWEAGQRLASGIALRLVGQRRAGAELSLPAVLVEAVGKLLAAPLEDRALQAEALILPSEDFLAEHMEVVDVDGIHQVRELMRAGLARELREGFLEQYHANHRGGTSGMDAEAGRRRLKNLCLAYLLRLEDPQALALCMEQFHGADNMTDTMAALNAVNDCDCEERPRALDAFYERWRRDPLVLDKWLSLQARSTLPGALDRVRGLMDHEAFDIKNPNKVRALIGTFSRANPVHFHDPSGEGYRFLADQVIRLDALNPQIAARLLGALSRWRRYDSRRQEHMTRELQRVLDTEGLSSDCYEIASKSLAVA